VASAGGIVIHSAPIKYYGETIIIKHNSTVLDGLLQPEGKVGTDWARRQQRGQDSASRKEAQSGKSYLYFEIRYKNRARNPIFYLAKKEMKLLINWIRNKEEQ